MARHLRKIWLLACILLAGSFWATSVAAQTGSTGYTQTRYPIVLVHGMFGFDTLLGLVQYWDNIPSELEQGGAKVYVVQLSPLQTDQVRGEQLLNQLQALQALYGYTKFNLIGHSQGGTTSRYIAAIHPELVASLTTVGTPHHGSQVADAVVSIAPGNSLAGKFVAAIINLVGQVESVGSGAGLTAQNFTADVAGLTTANLTAFNQLYPQGAPTTSCGSGPELASNGVRYYSIGGIQPFTNPLDISDYALGIGSLFFNGGLSDGVVGQCSSHWGVVLRDTYPWNHLDEVNQLFGLRGLFSPDPGEVLRTQVNRLKVAGL